MSGGNMNMGDNSSLKLYQESGVGTAAMQKSKKEEKEDEEKEDEEKEDAEMGKEEMIQWALRALERTRYLSDLESEEEESPPPSSNPGPSSSAVGASDTQEPQASSRSLGNDEARSNEGKPDEEGTTSDSRVFSTTAAELNYSGQSSTPASARYESTENRLAVPVKAEPPSSSHNNCSKTGNTSDGPVQLKTPVVKAEYSLPDSLPACAQKVALPADSAPVVQICGTNSDIAQLKEEASGSEVTSPSSSSVQLLEFCIKVDPDARLGFSPGFHEEPLEGPLALPMKTEVTDSCKVKEETEEEVSTETSDTHSQSQTPSLIAETIIPDQLPACTEPLVVKTESSTEEQNLRNLQCLAETVGRRSPPEKCLSSACGSLTQQPVQERRSAKTAVQVVVLDSESDSDEAMGVDTVEQDSREEGQATQDASSDFPVSSEKSGTVSFCDPSIRELGFTIYDCSNTSQTENSPDCTTEAVSCGIPSVTAGRSPFPDCSSIVQIENSGSTMTAVLQTSGDSTPVQMKDSTGCVNVAARDQSHHELLPFEPPSVISNCPNSVQSEDLRGPFLYEGLSIASSISSNFANPVQCENFVIPAASVGSEMSDNASVTSAQEAHIENSVHRDSVFTDGRNPIPLTSVRAGTVSLCDTRTGSLLDMVPTNSACKNGITTGNSTLTGLISVTQGNTNLSGPNFVTQGNSNRTGPISLPEGNTASHLLRLLSRTVNTNASYSTQHANKPDTPFLMPNTLTTASNTISSCEAYLQSTLPQTPQTYTGKQQINLHPLAFPRNFYQVLQTVPAASTRSSGASVAKLASTSTNSQNPGKTARNRQERTYHSAQQISLDYDSLVIKLDDEDSSKNAAVRSDSWMCSVCDRTFSSHGILIQHKKTHFIGENCKLSDSDLINDSELKMPGARDNDDNERSEKRYNLRERSKLRNLSAAAVGDGDNDFGSDEDKGANEDNVGSDDFRSGSEDVANEDDTVIEDKEESDHDFSDDDDDNDYSPESKSGSNTNNDDSDYSAKSESNTNDDNSDYSAKSESRSNSKNDGASSEEEWRKCTGCQRTFSSRWQFYGHFSICRSRSAFIKGKKGKRNKDRLEKPAKTLKMGRQKQQNSLKFHLNNPSNEPVNIAAHSRIQVPSSKQNLKKVTEPEVSSDILTVHSGFPPYHSTCASNVPSAELRPPTSFLRTSSDVPTVQGEPPPPHTTTASGNLPAQCELFPRANSSHSMAENSNTSQSIQQPLTEMISREQDSSKTQVPGSNQIIIKSEDSPNLITVSSGESTAEELSQTEVPDVSTKYGGRELQNKAPKKAKCMKCGEEISSVEEASAHMKRHFRLKEVNKKSAEGGTDLKETTPGIRKDNVEYLCTLCEKPLGLGDAIVEHVKSHFQFICNQCQMGYGSESLLEVHKRKCTGVYHPCPICVKGLKDPNCLPNHMLSHLQKICPVCGEFLRTGWGNHPGKHFGIRLADCNICGRTYKISLMTLHIAFDHGGRQCKRCNEHFSTWPSLKRHRRKCRKKKNVGTEKKRSAERRGSYECDKCKRTFTKRYHLLLHFQKDCYKSLYKHVQCNQCDRWIASGHLMQQHIKRAHSKSLCSICGKSVKHMYAHMKTHLESTKAAYKCAQCGNTFRQKHHLQVHMRKHTGERPYQCEECGDRFKTVGHLINHRETHKPLSERRRVVRRNRPVTRAPKKRD